MAEHVQTGSGRLFLCCITKQRCDVNETPLWLGTVKSYGQTHLHLGAASTLNSAIGCYSLVIQIEGIHLYLDFGNEFSRAQNIPPISFPRNLTNRVRNLR